jgi:TRAP-type mannitol/chloroaromatic compound transport system permease small subunit
MKLNIFLKFIDKINNVVGVYISYLILILIGLVVFTVFTRYIFSMQNIWSYETTQFIFGTSFVLAGGFIAYKKSHVNVEVIYNRFSIRNRAIVDLVTALFFFVFIISMIWFGWREAWSAFELRQATESAWGPPIYPIKFIIPIGAFLLFLQGIAKFIRDIRIASGRSTDEH